MIERKPVLIEHQKTALFFKKVFRPCTVTPNYGQVHPVNINFPSAVSRMGLKSTCGKLNRLDIAETDTHLCLLHVKILIQGTSVINLW